MPTVYNDSLSYLEMIATLQTKINELIGYIEQLNIDLQGIEQRCNGYTDIQIQQIQTEFTNRIDDIYSFINKEVKKLEQADEHLKEYVDIQDLKLYNKFTDVYLQIELLNIKINNQLQKLIAYCDKEFQNTYYILKNYVTGEVAKLQKEIDNISSGKIKCFNPLTGGLTSLDKTIVMLYDNLRVYGVAAMQIDVEQMTAEFIDSMSMTAIEFDLYYTEKMRIYKYRHCYSPFDGSVTTYDNLIYQLYANIRNGYTATGYDGLSLTATTYDNKQASAYTYDWVSI